MIRVMENVKKLNIDKSDWVPTQLGDLAVDISKRVDNPSTSIYDKFVGLEHFVSGELKIKNWGTTENLSSSAKAFQTGDILFARRNAYLRRASFVEFDGCCSGDAFVLRENHDKVVPGFLAFLMNSDDLWNFANSNAAGTMSKRVKWRDLANYQFLLPPKDQQARLAELLWALDEVIEREREVVGGLEMTKKGIFYSSIFTKSAEFNKLFGANSPLHNVEKLGNLLTNIQYGISESLNDDGKIPVLRMNNLQNGKVDFTDIKYYTPSNVNFNNFILDIGDILFNRTNSFDLVGKVSLYNDNGKHSFASYLIRIKTQKDKLDPRFLNFYLNSPIGIAKIRRYRTPGVSQSNINAQNLKNIPVPLPSINSQRALMDKINLIEQSEAYLKNRALASVGLQKSLINQLF